jgi:hypothetical protein
MKNDLHLASSRASGAGTIISVKDRDISPHLFPPGLLPAYLHNFQGGRRIKARVEGRVDCIALEVQNWSWDRIFTELLIQ